jgi:hypothetical protein
MIKEESLKVGLLAPQLIGFFELLELKFQRLLEDQLIIFLKPFSLGCRLRGVDTFHNVLIGPLIVDHNIEFSFEHLKMLKDIKSGRSIFIITFTELWPKENLKEFFEMMVYKFTTPFTSST